MQGLRINWPVLFFFFFLFLNEIFLLQSCCSLTTIQNKLWKWELISYPLSLLNSEESSPRRGYYSTF